MVKINKINCTDVMLVSLVLLVLLVCTSSASRGAKQEEYRFEPGKYEIFKRFSRGGMGRMRPRTESDEMQRERRKFPEVDSKGFEPDIFDEGFGEFSTMKRWK